MGWHVTAYGYPVLRDQHGQPDQAGDHMSAFPAAGHPFWEMTLRDRGLFFGYPACCAEEFEADVLAGRSPGLLRRLNIGGWVMCSACEAKS